MKRLLLISCLVLLTAAACGGKKPPAAAAPAPFPGAIASAGPTERTAARPPDPPPVPVESTGITARPLGDPYSSRDIKDINDNSPLKPVFFLYDSDQLDDAGRKVLAANAEILKQYATWVVTVEGHCDERGTAEYNLALGDRRALAARNYLLTLGVAAGRLRTVSYGKEFPFDAGHDESAWSHNRRAHFMLTSK